MSDSKVGALHRLRNVIREICSTAEFRARELKEICRELDHELGFYERVLREKEIKGGGR